MAELTPGQRLGDYTVIELLGRGGMGAVFKARDERLGRIVAIKVLNEGTKESVRRRFELEARAAAKIDHPNIARVFASGEQDGVVYLVVELLTGGSLKSRLRQGRIEWREAVRHGAAIARGLAVIHAAGLVHRDLKPENVLLDEKGRPKITDFGLVRADGELKALMGGSLTRTGELLGTLEYLAPELSESGKVDHRADLYALGATLFALLTGKPPYFGQGFDLIVKHLKAPVPSARRDAPEIPAELDALVTKLLAKNPEERPSSAKEVAEALESIGKSAKGGGPGMLVPALLAGAGLACALVGVGIIVGRSPSDAVAPVATVATVATAAVPRFRESPARPLPKDCAGFLETRHARLLAARGSYAGRGTSAMESLTPLGADRIVTSEGSGILRVYRSADLEQIGHARPFVDANVKEGRRVGYLAALPDGETVLVGGPLGTVSLFHVSDWREVLLPLEHARSVRCVAVSPSGARALTGDDDGTIILWDLARKTKVTSLKHPHAGPVTSIVFRGETQAVIGGHRALCIWDLEKRTSRLLDELVSEDEKGAKRAGMWLGIALSADANELVAGTSLKIGRHWRDLDTPTPQLADTFAEPDGWLISAAFAGPGLLLTGSDHRSLRFRSVESGRVETSLSLVAGSWLYGILVPPGGRRAIVSTNHGLRVVDLATRKEVRPAGHVAGVRKVAALPGRRFVSASLDGTVLLWRPDRERPDLLADAGIWMETVAAAEDRVLVTPQEGAVSVVDESATVLAQNRVGSGYHVRCSALSSDASLALVGYATGEVLLLDGRAKVLARVEVPAEASTVAFARKRPRFLAGSRAGVLEVMDWEGSALSRVATIRGRGVRDAVFLPDGDAILAGHDDGSVRLVPVSAPEKGTAFARKHDGAVRAVALSADGQVAASAGEDGVVRLWLVAERTLLDEIDMRAIADVPATLAFDGDSRLLVGTDRSVVLELEVAR